MLNDDWNLIEQALEHPLIKLFTAVYGRFGQARWEDEGFTPVMPADWKYHLHWQPNLPSRDDLLRVIDAVTPGMVEATFEAYSGSVDRVASDAGLVRSVEDDAGTVRSGRIHVGGSTDRTPARSSRAPNSLPHCRIARRRAPGH